MFRFTMKPSSGSHNQYLAKITHLVKSRYVDLVQDNIYENTIKFNTQVVYMHKTLSVNGVLTIF